jgi:hypothetical protein
VPVHNGLDLEQRAVHAVTLIAVESLASNEYCTLQQQKPP